MYPSLTLRGMQPPTQSLGIVNTFPEALQLWVIAQSNSSKLQNHLVYVPPPQLSLKWKALCFHLNIWNFDLFGTYEGLSAVSPQMHLSHTVQWGIGSLDVTFSACSVVYETGHSQESCGAWISYIWAALHHFCSSVIAPLNRRGTLLPPFAIKYEDCHPQIGGRPKTPLDEPRSLSM